VPSGNQLNGAGTTSTVLAHVRANQTVMLLISAVQNLTNAELADVAAYIAATVPAATATTQMNTPVNVSVASHITLTGQIWSAYDAVEVVTPPSNGTLGAFTGTSATYTPANGFIGTDTFTYRGKRTGVHDGDPRTVTITVTPQAPVITSMLTANGTFNVAFNYQITASNSPTSYGASGLPAGLSIDTMTGVISGTPTAAGSSMVTISATNAGGTGMATLMLNLAQASQTINFPAQTTPRTFSQGGTFAISPTATGGLSGNSINYGSTTTGVCTVSGTTVTMVAAGTCTLSANQAGNTNYAAAPQVTQNVTIDAVAPGAATVGTVTAGNAQATVNFTAPLQTGGAPILSFTLNCGGITATGGAAPLTVTGLNNGMTYTCFVRTTNTAMLSTDSATFMVTPISIQFANNVFSRKMHGAVAGDIPINHATPANGNVDVEPRVGNGPHTVYFEFTSPVSNPGSVVVTNVTTGLPISGPTVAALTDGMRYFAVVSLTGVPDIARITLALTGVNGTVDASASMGLLPGDVNGTGRVTAADIAAIKTKSGNTTVDAVNYKLDLNVSGAISSTDVNAVKAKAGRVLP
jgi:hypothetical protein